MCCSRYSSGPFRLFFFTKKLFMRIDLPQWLSPTVGGGHILGVSQQDVNTVTGMTTVRTLITMRNGELDKALIFLSVFLTSDNHLITNYSYLRRESSVVVEQMVLRGQYKR